LLCASALGQTANAVWIDVPFVAQPRDGCGAASISMVMRYWSAQEHHALGPDADVTAIQQQLYVPREHGIPAPEMVQYLRQHGYLAFAVNGAWSDLEENIKKGRPLIVALRPPGQSELHYVVIAGVDPQHGSVTMNDPAERKLLTDDRQQFERDWSATHDWMLLAVPAQSPSGSAAQPPPAQLPQ
jgi:ABC-type bacteriocin/lantibiotic exporter with double-glycine peptidase domain